MANYDVASHMHRKMFRFIFLAHYARTTTTTTTAAATTTATTTISPNTSVHYVVRKYRFTFCGGST